MLQHSKLMNLSISRQPKIIYLAQAEGTHDFDDVAREQWRMSIQEFFDVHEELGKFTETQEELGERITRLEDELEKMRGFVDVVEKTLHEKRRVVVIKELSHDDAKQLVERYMRENKTADTEELLLKLGIELRILVEILDELKAEGRITVAETD